MCGQVSKLKNVCTSFNIFVFLTMATLLDFVIIVFQLWLTKDLGRSWTRLQEMVKAFFWVADEEGSQTLLIQRQEPTTSSVIVLSGDLGSNSERLTVLIEDVVDFWVKRDFMFATREVNGVSITACF